jgi:hypothetical protein
MLTNALIIFQVVTHPLNSDKDDINPLQSTAEVLFYNYGIKVCLGNPKYFVCIMKLKDCDCGGIREVTYNINDNTEFVVVCVACGNLTFVCECL